MKMTNQITREIETPREIEARLAKRRIEVKFETQCRQITGITIKREPVELNPLADALKGIGV